MEYYTRHVSNRIMFELQGVRGYHEEAEGFPKFSKSIGRIKELKSHPLPEVICFSLTKGNELRAGYQLF